MGIFDLFSNEGFDEKVEQFSMREYYYLLQISGLVFYSRGRWFWLAVLQFIFFLIMLLAIIITMGYTIYLLKDYQFSLTALLLHIFIGFTLCLAILISVNLNRDQFIAFLTINERGYYNYGNNYVYKKVNMWKKEVQQFDRQLIIFITIYFFFVGTVGIGQPLIDMYQGITLNVSYVNGVYMNLPVPIYIPYKIETYFQTIGFILFEIIEDGLIVVIVCSSIILIIKFTFSVVNQLRILIHYIENIEGRTLHICKSKYPSFKTPNSSRKLYKNPLFLAEYELCLKQNFEHFNVIREAVKILDGIIRWPMFLAILTFSLVLACALLTLIKGDTRIAPQLLSIMLLLMEAIACAKICEGGERISHLSDEVFSSFYKTKWIHCPHRIKTSMLIIQECSKKPLSIKASGITEINWNLFTKIMNSAYTYFNVLYAMDSTN